MTIRSRNQVTGDYLADVAARGEDPGALRAAALAAAVAGRAERDLLESDLRHLQTALTALPDRLFGGDLGGFARAAGMTEAQMTAILRGSRPSGTAPTGLTRADLYHDGASFRLMELNIGSTVGGLDNAVLNKATLSHPPFADFAAEHKLSYPDTMAELADMLRTDYATDSGRPVRRGEQRRTGRPASPRWSRSCGRPRRCSASSAWRSSPATSVSSRSAAARSGSAAGTWTWSTASS